MGEYEKLLRRSSIAVALCLAAVLLCYFWIDRPVAFFVHRHHFNEITVLRWLTYPPPEVQTWSPLILTILAVRRALGPLSRWQKCCWSRAPAWLWPINSVSASEISLVATGRRLGFRTTRRSSALEPTASIRLSVATTWVASLQVTPPES